MSLVDQWKYSGEGETEEDVEQSVARHFKGHASICGYDLSDFTDPRLREILELHPEGIYRPKKDDSYFYVPSSWASIKETAKSINSHLAPGSVIYDIGSGIGRVVLALAVLCPQMWIKGVEYEERYVTLANQNKEKYWANNAEFLCKDALEHNYSDADLIFFFAPLVAKQYADFRSKLAVELKPGCFLKGIDLTSQREHKWHSEAKLYVIE